MSELSKKYENIMNELESNVKDKEELKYIKDKISDLSVVFIDIIDRITQINEVKISELEDKQKYIENKLSIIEKTVNDIEKDIYAEENYDFEIICPYCNNEFVADYMTETEIKKEIQCPECKNIIELDWNEDFDEYQGCSGSCSSCNGCDFDEEDDM